MRVAAVAVPVTIISLCVFSAALAKAQARGANGPMAAAKVIPVNQREDATGDDRAMNQHLFPILSNNGDSEFETPPTRLRRIRRQYHQHRQLQKTESLISWLFESARDYWNFKQESKRDKQENEKDKENNKSD